MVAISDELPAAHVSSNLDALLIRVYRSYVFTPSNSGDEQLGLLYVATAAREHGYDVRVLDQPRGYAPKWGIQ
jgi:hypothetical protein